MKIYKAVLEYNNGEINEWEESYQEESEWYKTRELAEQHFPMLEQYRSYLLNKFRNNSSFRCTHPRIEEAEVAEQFTPIKLQRGFNGKPFDGFTYEPYAGPMSITAQRLNLWSWTSMDTWDIILFIGEEEFIVSFDEYINDDNGEDEYNERRMIVSKYCSIYKSSQENTKFWKYSLEDRNMLLGICKSYAETLDPLYTEYQDELNKLKTLDRKDRWTKSRLTDCKYMKRLLDTSHLVLSGVGEFIEDATSFMTKYSEEKECVKAFAELISYIQSK